MKEEVLETLDFDHFTTKQLASDVRKSGLYHSDKIIERMEQLFENKNSEFEEKEKKMRTESDQLKKEKDQLRTDMKAVKSKLNTGFYGSHYTPTNPWSEFLEEGLKSRYSSL